MRKFLFFIFIIFIISLFSMSCTRGAPEITYGFLKLVLYQGDAGIQEHFSFFIMPSDEDGIENLDKLYLYNDKEQLFWKINNDEWITYKDGNKTWIGTRSITVPEGELPRGSFRAVLYNKGGESAEKSFVYDGKVLFPFPELAIENGNYAVNSRWPANKLVCYDNTGAFITEVPLTALNGSISSLNLASNVSSAALWAEDEENFSSAFTNVVAVK